MLNVWLVTIGEPLPLDAGVRKLRTGIVSDHLISKGHKVRWWVSAFEHQRKKMMFDRDQEVFPSDGLILNVLHGCGYDRNISLKRLVDHRIIAGKFRRIAPNCTAPDIIVAAMPCYHLAYEAVRYARERNIPIVVDVRDLWPDIFVGIFESAVLKTLAKVLLYDEYRRLRYLLKHTDSILAMSKGVLQWALHQAHRTPGNLDRVFHLGYNRSRGGKVESPGWLSGREGERVVVYVGTFGASYELPLLVSAARRFHNAGRKDVCFVLAGTGEQEETLRQAISDLPNVVMPGWISTDEIAGLLRRAWLGVIPCRSVVDAMPNKTFEYLSADLPVVSSLEGEMAETIERHAMGLNYRPGDEKGLYQALKTIIDDAALRERMSTNAGCFFYEHGDADKIYDDYAGHIESVCEIVGRHGSGK
jgi:glycosyltransferase involved in cell wall biosynthesis